MWGTAGSSKGRTRSRTADTGESVPAKCSTNGCWSMADPNKIEKQKIVNVII